MGAKSKKLPVVLSLSLAGALVALIVISQNLRASATRTPATRQRGAGTPLKQQPQRSPKEEFERIKEKFPKVDYDSPEPTDPAERTKRRNKGKHFNNGGISKTPTRYSSGLNNHWDWGLPALPVEESNAVVVARTLSRAAFLSNDKTGVYTELSIRVEEVLKSNSKLLQNDCVIDINRRGGVVRYSTGEESLFLIQGQEMPLVGKRYLFFLKAIPDSVDFQIITGYELSQSGVKALDWAGQFAQFNGSDEGTFLSTVRDTIAQKNQQ
jgi:hypothetical protein